jgi:hypothetical protein
MGLKDTIVYGAAGNPDNPREGGAPAPPGGPGWFRRHVWSDRDRRTCRRLGGAVPGSADGGNR